MITGFLLLPALLRERQKEEFVKVMMTFADRYKDDLPSSSTLEQELCTYYTEWYANKTELELGELYAKSSACSLYPNISYLLKLLITIPVTSATTERAHSTLKFIKTKLRSSMGQGSLNTFVLGFKHKDLLSKVNIKQVVQQFIGMRPRRLLLPSPVSE